LPETGIPESGQKIMKCSLWNVNLPMRIKGGESRTKNHKNANRTKSGLGEEEIKKKKKRFVTPNLHPELPPKQERRGKEGENGSKLSIIIN